DRHPRRHVRPRLRLGAGSARSALATGTRLPATTGRALLSASPSCLSCLIRSRLRVRAVSMLDVGSDRLGSGHDHVGFPPGGDLAVICTENSSPGENSSPKIGHTVAVS